MLGIYVSIFKIKDTTLTCCMETGVLLFVYKYLSYETNKNPPLHFVIEQDPVEKGAITVDVTDFHFTTNTNDRINDILKNCNLPLYFFNELYCIAGFCAVLRQVGITFVSNVY